MPDEVIIMTYTLKLVVLPGQTGLPFCQIVMACHAALYQRVFKKRVLTTTTTTTTTTIIIIVNDINPVSSTHAKVVFREVLHPIKLEFGNVDFWGEVKTGEPGERPLGAE